MWWIVTTTVLLLGIVIVTGAQPAERVARVGYLVEGTSGPDPAGRRLEDGLRDHGYAPGTNVVIERRFAEGRMELLPDLIADLVRVPVDVIVTPSERTAVAKQVTTTIRSA